MNYLYSYDPRRSYLPWVQYTGRRCLRASNILVLPCDGVYETVLTGAIAPLRTQVSQYRPAIRNSIQPASATRCYWPPRHRVFAVTALSGRISNRWALSITRLATTKSFFALYRDIL